MALKKPIKGMTFDKPAAIRGQARHKPGGQVRRAAAQPDAHGEDYRTLCGEPAGLRLESV